MRPVLPLLVRVVVGAPLDYFVVNKSRSYNKASVIKKYLDCVPIRSFLKSVVQVCSKVLLRSSDEFEGPSLDLVVGYVQHESFLEPSKCLSVSVPPS